MKRQMQIKQVWCEEDKKFYPETISRNGRAYNLDPATFVYLEQVDLGLTYEEQQFMSEDIGHYGERWREYMTENYPEVIPSLQGRLKWSLSLDRWTKALEYRTLLRKQYAAKNPRSSEFAELVKWENKLGMLVGKAIMENVVLLYRE